jgi:hypothetical protein
MTNQANKNAREIWRKKCDQVALEMKGHTRPFIMPLSIENESDVRHVGTGSIINWAGKNLLLTCKHVQAEGAINFSFYGSENVLATVPPFNTDVALDAAFVEIGAKQWNAFQHQAILIPESRIATQHKPGQGEELLFFHGFAGENSHYAFGVLDSGASAYVTQQSAEAEDDNKIFELLWEPEETEYIESTSAEVRQAMRFMDPGGFSGSLVWNTRYLEVTSAGEPWTPECAEVTGLLKRWDTGTKTLLVSKVEHLRAYLAVAAQI